MAGPEIPAVSLPSLWMIRLALVLASRMPGTPEACVHSAVISGQAEFRNQRGTPHHQYVNRARNMRGSTG